MHAYSDSYIYNIYNKLPFLHYDSHCLATSTGIMRIGVL